MISRLEMREGICFDEEFIYPVLFKGTTSVDYQMETFVLSRENNVTMQELVAYYNEKEDTDTSLRSFDPEKFDLIILWIPKQNNLMSIYPWILLTTIMKKCLVN